VSRARAVPPSMLRRICSRCRSLGRSGAAGVKLARAPPCQETARSRSGRRGAGAASIGVLNADHHQQPKPDRCCAEQLTTARHGHAMPKEYSDSGPCKPLTMYTCHCWPHSSGWMAGHRRPAAHGGLCSLLVMLAASHGQGIRLAEKAAARYGCSTWSLVRICSILSRGAVGVRSLRGCVVCDPWWCWRGVGMKQPALLPPPLRHGSEPWQGSSWLVRGPCQAGPCACPPARGACCWG
jgi:hypothetical protein